MADPYDDRQKHHDGNFYNDGPGEGNVYVDGQRSGATPGAPKTPDGDTAGGTFVFGHPDEMGGIKMREGAAAHVVVDPREMRGGTNVQNITNPYDHRTAPPTNRLGAAVRRLNYDPRTTIGVAPTNLNYDPRDLRNSGSTSRDTRSPWYVVKQHIDIKGVEGANYTFVAYQFKEHARRGGIVPANIMRSLQSQATYGSVNAANLYQYALQCESMIRARQG